MKCYLNAWVKLRSVFDVSALEAKIQDLEEISAQPGFWDKHSQAQKILQQLNHLKVNLKQYYKWKDSLEDSKAVLELLEIEVDVDLLEEALSKTSQLNCELEKWELLQLLSGTYDSQGAVLTINAGAGGTDAQDWAEMLQH